jgi:hypothetical protein
LHITYTVAIVLCGSEICGLNAQFLAQLVDSVPATLSLLRDSRQRIEHIQNEQAEADAAAAEQYSDGSQDAGGSAEQPSEGWINTEYRASAPPPRGARMTATTSNPAGQSLFDGLKAGIQNPGTLALVPSVAHPTMARVAQAGRNAGFRKVGFRLPVRVF